METQVVLQGLFPNYDCIPAQNVIKHIHIIDSKYVKWTFQCGYLQCYGCQRADPTVLCHLSSALPPHLPCSRPVSKIRRTSSRRYFPLLLLAVPTLFFSFLWYV